VHVIENLPAAESMTGLPERTNSMDPELYREWRARTRTLSHMALSRPIGMTMTGRGEAVRLQGLQVSAPLLPMLQVAPMLGRTFQESEDRPGSDGVVILSYSTWVTHFAGDPDVIGRPLALDGRDHVVVGVMPRDFAYPDAFTDFWTPLALSVSPGQFIRLGAVARVTEGIAVPEAEREGNAIARAFLGLSDEQDAAMDGAPRIQLVTWKDRLVDPLRPALLVFAVAVTLVLLIGCVNVANLLLARAMDRRREIAVRMALGASRRRVLRQLLTESLTLAMAGGAAGCLLAGVGTRWLVTAGQRIGRLDLIATQSGGSAIARLNEVDFDVTVLLYALALSALTGVLCGLSPARHLSGLDEGGPARARGSGDSGLHRVAPHSRPGGVLIVGQVALTMVLLLGAGLLIRSFLQLTRVEMGFDPGNVVAFQMPKPRLPFSGGNFRANIALQQGDLDRAERVVSRIRAIPGVDSAALASSVPMTQMPFMLSLRAMAEAPAVPIPRGKLLVAGPQYFEVMGIRVLAGRGFRDGDLASRRATFVINQALATVYFGREDPLGRTVHLWGRVSGEIVGVVGDIRSALDLEPEPQLFLSPFQSGDYLPIQDGGLYVAVRAVDGMSAAALAPQIRSIVRETDPEAPVASMASIEDILADSVATRRFQTFALGLLALVALLLAGTGLYGVLSYMVRRRQHEIGVRMALGARVREVIWLVARRELGAALAGMLVGLLGAVALTRYLETMLFGLTPRDPTTFVAATLLFGAVAAAAATGPAWRATRTDPAAVLRNE
jgi:putative ABC transport system permease protein